MKAYELQRSFGLDHLIVVDRPEPVVSAGTVAVRLRAASLNYRDLLVVRGVYNPRLRLPLVPLSDGSGEVIELGAGVTQFQVGDQVTFPFFPAWKDGPLTKAKAASALGGDVDGVLQEIMVVPADVPVKNPVHLDFKQSASLPCAAVTAWNALHENGTILPGQHVLLIGTGGVSLFGLQLAKMAGAQVILLSRSAEKLERARNLGADHTINTRDTPDWEKVVLQLTNGEGVNVTLEVSGAGTLNKTLKATCLGGRVSLIGVVAGRVGELDIALVLHKAIRVQGIYVGSRAMLQRLTHAAEQHRLFPQIDRTFSWTEIPEAFAYLEKGTHFGKIGVEF